MDAINLTELTAGDAEAELARRREVVRKRLASTLKRRLELAQRAVKQAAAGRCSEFLMRAHAEKLAQALSDFVGEQ